MIIIVIWFLIIVYVLELLIMRIGINRADRIPVRDAYSPRVSIIVAARNEEEFIGGCVRSLLKIDYPKESLEIIIVNDGSTDRTAEIVESISKDHIHIKLISSIPGIGNLKGKANALDQGITQSSGDILMFTDADCTVQPAWVKNTVRYFTPDVGIVGGFTILNAHRIFEGIQSLDWLFLFSLASAAVGWNKPLTVIGNNLSMTKEAYQKTGGYGVIPFSVTEDYAIVQAVLTRTTFRVRFPLDPRVAITSQACQSFTQLYHQKQRWGVGGLDMIAFGFVIMALGWIGKMALILSLFFIGFVHWFPLLLLMMLGEMLFISKSMIRFRIGRFFKYFPPFFVYFFCYVLIIPFVAFFTKHIYWKERRL
jgi:cellulose synthase/poly-beta-1,6-N-acetylglucosamine synthase-like glycosyltransferase